MTFKKYASPGSPELDKSLNFSMTQQSAKFLRADTARSGEDTVSMIQVLDESKMNPE